MSSFDLTKAYALDSGCRTLIFALLRAARPKLDSCIAKVTSFSILGSI